jgi:hypothetical protein
MSIKGKNKLLFLLLGIVIGALFFVSKSFSSSPDGVIDSTDKYAWSENTGWISFGESSGNVRVTDSVLTGYAWSENAGWISLNCSNDNSCSTVDYKVVNDGEGNLSGYAWSENMGWISFNPSGGGVVINSSGEFVGYGWGENIGWVSFNCSNDNSCASASYKVKTDWRPQSLRPACSNGLDDDGDGLIDYPADKGCADANDNSEIDGSVAFVPPVRPSVKTVSVEFKNGNLSFEGLPASIVQVAVSTSSNFSGASWEDISQKEDLLKNYKDAQRLYIKFRGRDGGVSDVIVYSKNGGTGNGSGNSVVINEGDIVKTINNPDVYIIKYKGGKQYKRLILSPSVFKSYQHLKWENIKVISQTQLDGYITSNLVQVAGDKNLYELFPSGDTGERKVLDMSKAYDIDSVYEINSVDRNSYKLVK